MNKMGCYYCVVMVLVVMISFAEVVGVDDIAGWWLVVK